MRNLKQGDIIYTDINPTVGHEQSGKRPAVVLNNKSCDKFSAMTIICPITSNNREYPTKVELKNTKTKGFVLCDQIRALDLSNRSYTYLESMDDDTLWDVIDCVRSLIEKLP
ncbi:MAG: type II toxin-antitoxin system PemK/MazF family toxin [Ruminococcus sp.]|nr:type II toxin-antitoxin system PemK/MazF family toxin [Ruminococcus sp.]